MKIIEVLREDNAFSNVVNKVQGYLSPQPAPTTAQPIPGRPVAAKPAVPTQPVIYNTAKAEPASFNPALHKPTLIQIAKQRGIKTVHDLSNLLSQCETETAKWTAAAENFNYTDPTRIYKVFTSAFKTPAEAAYYVSKPVALANRALANKNGNGPENTGDGWRFRGRGFIHLTGRENYARAGAAVHPENPSIYVNNPELVSSNPKEAALVAIWFFKSKVGLGKTSKQATAAVSGAAGMKAKERSLAQAKIKKDLTVAAKKVPSGGAALPSKSVTKPVAKPAQKR